LSVETGPRILRLGIRSVAFLGLFFGAWLLARDPYGRILAGTLNAVLPMLESLDLTDRVTFVPSERSFAVLSSKVILPPDAKVHGFASDLHFGVVVFAALVFATLPNLRLRTRAILVALGAVLLFPVHILEIHVFNQLWYATAATNVRASYTDGQAQLYNWIAQVLRHGEMAFPVVLWVFVYFAPLRPAARPQAPATRRPPPPGPPPPPEPLPRRPPPAGEFSAPRPGDKKRGPARRTLNRPSDPVDRAAPDPGTALGVESVFRQKVRRS